jgi:hypothetical protein
VPFSTWELPEQAMAFCLAEAGLSPADLDAVAYSYDPDLAPAPGDDITADEWEGLRTLYARRAPRFLHAALPGSTSDAYAGSATTSPTRRRPRSPRAWTRAPCSSSTAAASVPRT